MGKKGGNKKTKALYAPKTVNIKRKEAVWTVHTRAGAHKRKESVALGIVLRDLVKIAQSMKEVKTILLAKNVKVNGKLIFDPRSGVGLFDTIDIEAQKLFFRIVLDSKGRFFAKSIDKKSNEKVAKVAFKKMTAKGIQITTGDGRVLFSKEANVDDSVKISLPEGKVTEVLPLAKGAVVFITKGEHCSEIATVNEIVPGTVKRSKLVKLTSAKKEFETIPENMIVIGKGKSALADIQ